MFAPHEWAGGHIESAPVGATGPARADPDREPNPARRLKLHLRERARASRTSFLCSRQ